MDESVVILYDNVGPLEQLQGAELYKKLSPKISEPHEEWMKESIDISEYTGIWDTLFCLILYYLASIKATNNTAR